MKTSQLTALSAVDALDLLAVSDVSAGQSKKITAQNFMRSLTGVMLPNNVDLSVADATAQAALTPFEGMLIYRKDIDKQLIYDGTTWRVLIGWELLGSQTLGSAGDTISLTSLPARKFLRVVVSLLNSGQLNWGFRFNNDSGTNYSMNYSVNFGAQQLVVSTNNLFAGSIGSANFLSIVDIVNIANQSKIAHIHTGDNGGNNSAGTAGNAFDAIGKWANTSNQITRIDAFNIGTGDFAVGSQILVLGHD